ncbi:MAG: ATP-binding protein [Lachnospiraceae bacterium]|nr:ATP-binding protein [Lachnospiraceae bacterium]
MSVNEAIYNKIMAEYEAVRDSNRHILTKRKQEVYEKIPEYRALDREIADTAILSATEYINGLDVAMEDRHQKISRLSQKKLKLLSDAGYPKDYLSPIYTCKDCQDTGYIGHRKCHCLKQRLIDMRYEQSNLRNVLEEENFSHWCFDIFPADVQEDVDKIYSAAQNFCKSFANNYRNMLFLGNVGSGKTFLANCIAKEILDQGYSVLYFSALQMFQKLNDYTFHRDYSDSDSHEYYRDILDTELLIIDDLGTETTSSLDRSQFFHVLNERGLRKKPTIISTNLSLETLKYNYSERSLSRLLSGYDIYRFYWTDLRLHSHKKT